jgi:transcriptional regulator with XRE-family HTH domain
MSPVPLGKMKQLLSESCNLTEVRAKKGLSQKEFSTMLGITHGRLNQIERGEAIPSRPVQILAELISKGIYPVANDTINTGGRVASVYSFRPAAYDIGAWQIEATLSKAALKQLRLKGFPTLWFDVPCTERASISNNIIFTDIILGNDAKVTRKGKFKNRVWQANLYIAEDPGKLTEDDLDSIALRAEERILQAIEDAFDQVSS